MRTALLVFKLYKVKFWKSIFFSQNNSQLWRHFHQVCPFQKGSELIHQTDNSVMKSILNVKYERMCEENKGKNKVIITC